MAMGAWLVGRLTAWRLFGRTMAVLAFGCLVAAFGSEATTVDESQQPNGLLSGLLVNRFSGISLPLFILVILLGACSLISSLLRRPPAGMGGLVVLLCLTLGSLLGYHEVMDVLSDPVEEVVWSEGWRQALELIRAYPFAGVGWGAWDLVGQAWSHGRGILPPPGGAFTGAVIELGVPGGLLLLGLLVLAPVTAWRERHTYPFRRMRLAVGLMQAVLLVFFAMALTGISVFSGPVGLVLWALFGCITGMVLVRDPARAFGGSLVIPGQEDRRGFWGSLVRSFLVVGITVFVGIPVAAQILAGPPQPNGESVRSLERATAIWPESGELQLRLVDALQREVRSQGRTIPDVRTAARMEEALVHAVNANPYRPHAHEALYFWHRDANDPARALQAIRKGVRYNPSSLELRLLLVRELERGGSLALATHHLKLAALRSSGGDQASLMLQLAELFEQRGLKDQARRWWQYAQQVGDFSTQTQSRLRRLGERLHVRGPAALTRGMP
jgi:hypothetical protein